MSASSKPVPLAIPNELLARVEDVAHRMHRSKQDIMRMAMEVGLEDLKRINYDITAAIVDAVERTKVVPLAAALAEPAATYGAQKIKRKA